MRFNLKDKQLREAIYKKQYLRKFCLFLRSHLTLNERIRVLGATYLSQQKTTRFFLSRVRNRCIITGRGRGVYTVAKSSRHILKQMAGYGLLPGYHNSSF